jgi:hypothetical protein
MWWTAIVSPDTVLFDPMPRQRREGSGGEVNQDGTVPRILRSNRLDTGAFDYGLTRGTIELLERQDMAAPSGEHVLVGHACMTAFDEPEVVLNCSGKGGE